MKGSTPTVCSRTLALAANQPVRSLLESLNSLFAVFYTDNNPKFCSLKGLGGDLGHKGGVQGFWDP